MLRAAIVLGVFIFLASVFATPPLIATELKITRPQTDVIHVTSHGWHAGIIFPRALLTEKIPGLAERFPEGNYLEIGWGDEGFYQANEITTGITLNALLWPTDSVVHLVSVPESPYLSFAGSDTRTLCLPEDQLDRLGDFLANSFLRDQQGGILPGRPGIYGNSQFYAGQGQYHLLNTCNTWLARGLQSAGFDINPVFKLTASSVMRYLDTLEPVTPVVNCD